MGNPENSATSNTTKVVGDAVKLITTDEEGNYVFPDDVELSDELKFAATAERRRRDTQNSYTKGQQTLKELQAANDVLMEMVNGNIKLTKEQQTELEEMKMKDPEAWRSKLNQYENEAKEAQEAKIAELTGEVRKKAGGEFELSRRIEVLKEFNETHGVKITDELIQNEIPPRITKKLEDGKVTFEEYLEEVYTYATTNKVIDNPKPTGGVDLSKAGGGKQPANFKPEVGLSASYKNDIY